MRRRGRGARRCNCMRKQAESGLAQAGAFWEYSNRGSLVPTPTKALLKLEHSALNRRPKHCAPLGCTLREPGGASLRGGRHAACPPRAALRPPLGSHSPSCAAYGFLCTTSIYSHCLGMPRGRQDAFEIGQPTRQTSAALRDPRPSSPRIKCRYKGNSIFTRFSRPHTRINALADRGQRSELADRLAARRGTPSNRNAALSWHQSLPI